MAAPVKILAPDGKPARRYVSSNNQQWKAATHSNDREVVPNLNLDSSRNVSRYGLNKLRDVGRFMFANFPVVHGAVVEQAELAGAVCIPQFVGDDKSYGETAESWLKEWYRIMDIRGWPFDDVSFRVNLVIAIRRDGDAGVVLVVNEEGYPFIQVIPGHRIGSALEETEVKGGEFDGFQIWNGVIYDDFGRVAGYRVYEDGYIAGAYKDVSTRDMFLVYLPEYADQQRGFSSLSCCAFDWLDVSKRREFELLALKLGSSIGLMEHNEEGHAPTDQDAIAVNEDQVTNQTTEAGSRVEKIDGVSIRYFRAGSGSKIETLGMDRPTANSQEFEASIIRGALMGMEWPVDFALDPSRVGGAQMRVVIEKVNRTKEKLENLLDKVMRRINGYALSKASKLGLVPASKDWWKWEHQFSARLTADAKYDDEIEQGRIKLGAGTYRDYFAKRGLWYQDEFRQRVREQKELEDICKAEGVDINKVQLLTPNGNQMIGEQPSQPKEKEDAKAD